MILGTSYIQERKGKITMEDDCFWQLVDMDITFIANEKHHAYVDGNMSYVNDRKSRIYKEVNTSKTPEKTYESLIKEFGYNRAKRQKSAGEYNENIATTTHLPDNQISERVGDVNVKSDVAPQKSDDIPFYNSEEENKEIEPEKIQDYFSQFQRLTALETHALLNKTIGVEKHPMPLFNEKGIRLIAYRALIKMKLFPNKYL